jgi:hypothetical protein
MDRAIADYLPTLHQLKRLFSIELHESMIVFSKMYMTAESVVACFKLSSREQLSELRMTTKIRTPGLLNTN